MIGLIGGIVCFYGVTVLKKKFAYDDALDAFGCHGIGGIWGGIATGIFATSSINPAIEGGLLDGNIRLLVAEVISILAVVAYAGIVSYLLLKLISQFMQLRVSAQEEEIGLDYAIHGETAYGSIAVALSEPNHSNSDGSVVLGELRTAFQKFQERSFTGNGPELAFANSNPEDLNQSVVVEYQASGTTTASSGANNKITKIEIITNESKFEGLKKALNNIGITGMTVFDVFGYGMQKGHSTYYRGVETEADLLPKIRVEVVVSTVPVHEVVAAARKALYTGNIGDGKIFIYNVENVIRVSTGDEGKKALEYPTE